MGEWTGEVLGACFYIFWGSPGLLFFPVHSTRESTFLFHAKSKLAYSACLASQAACSIQSGTEGIPCETRCLSIDVFCKLRNPGRRGGQNVLNW